MLLSEQESKDLCAKLLGRVRADDAAVAVTSDRRSHLRFAANTIMTSGHRQDLGVRVTVWVEKKKGSAATNELDDAALEGVVRQAEELARVSPVDDEYVPTLGPQRYLPSGGFVEATANTDAKGRARDMGQVIALCRESDAEGAGFHQNRGETQAGATRNGNFYYTRSTLASFSLTARTRQGGGSGYFLRNHFDVSKLDTARIGREAIGKALRSRDPRPLDPGVYAVILEPQAVADLLGFFEFSFDARRADEGRSPFSAPGGRTRLGEKIFDERLSLSSDPWHPELPASPVTFEAMPAEKLYLVKDGVLANLVYSRFWAQKNKKDATPGPVNAILESSGNPATLEEMIQATGRGLLISRFWYIRSLDPRTALETGLTRDGVWLIERGKISYPVRNFRFNQSILQLLAPGNVDRVGRPERVSSSESQGGNAALFPPLKVKEFHLASSSEAV